MAGWPTAGTTAGGGPRIQATIAKFIKEIGFEQQVTRRDLVIPGYVAQISGELEEMWRI